jgi:hypothetical protein
MPFKQGKTPADVARKINKALTVDLPKNIESGLIGMHNELAGTADFYVPIDTSALIQSRSYRIRPSSEGWTLTYGYYTDYAAALHERADWQPKPPNTKGKKGGGYNENARPNWMNIAWNEVGDDAVRTFGRLIEPK